VAQPAGIKPRTLITRVATALVFGLIAIGALLVGNRFFILPALCSIICFIGIREFYRLTAPHLSVLPRAIGLIMGASLPLFVALARTYSDLEPVLGTGGLSGLAPIFFAVAFGSFALMSWVAFTPTSTAKEAALALFGALYLGVPFSALVLIREMEGGTVLAAMTVVSVWAADTFAYFGGSLLGRHKIAPVISPKKSWEGFIAGICGSILVWILVPYLTGVQVPAISAVLVGTVIALAAFVGDLFESRLKREAQVKDSGTLLPGHGGMLDRIDSMLPVAMLLFIVLSLAGAILGIKGS